MDQVKIGKFIAKCRKEKGLTQMQLAEKLCITDRAVSKWENGKAMPDSSIMLELCDTLDITVNDLLNGERISSENYAKKMEMQLLDVVQEKELAEKRLLLLARLITAMALIVEVICLVVMFTTPYESEWMGNVIFTLTLIPMPCWMIVSWLDCSVGHFQCGHCGHIYKPTASALLVAFGGIRNKRLRCPHCGQKSWNKRVLAKK